MKKCLVLILSVIAAFTAIISLTACEAKVDKDGNVTITDGDKSNDNNNGGSGSGSQGGSETGSGSQGGSETGGNEDSGKLNKTEICSKNLTVSGNEVKGKVANAQTTFSFINDIEVADGATYTVCTDLACTKSVLSKTISLIDGDNVCYILVTNVNDINLYTVTVRRRPIYTVAFNSNGGTEIKSQQVEEDSLAAKPAAPEKTGYDFSGFDYDFSKPIVENTTINAKWEATKYKITYKLNGGVNDIDNPTTYTVEDKIELKPATKTGYTLKWSDNGVIEKGSTGDKTFTANWQVITYKIGYVIDGGTNNADNPTTYTVEDKIELKPATKTGYTFTSWDNNGVIEKGSVGDKTFTANWWVITYKISYVLNGGINDVQNPITYTVEDKIDLKSAIKTGYSCKWNSGGVIEKGSTGDKTFTANWEIITYKISYVLNGGINDAQNPTTYTVEDKIELKPAIKTGYTFTSWNNNGIIEKGSTGDITFTANWEIITYKISYVLNGGVNDTQNPTLYTVEDKTELKPAIKTGYTFTSWNNNGIIEKGSTGDITFTANYTADVKLSSDGTTVTGLNNAVSDLVILSEYNGVKVTRIEKGSFCNCNSLTSITISDGVTEIGFNAFGGSGNITKMVLPFVGAYAEGGGDAYFGYIFGASSYNEQSQKVPSSLKTIVLSDTVIKIDNYAFSGCKSLTSVTIPDSVTSIGDDAFSGCKSLTSVLWNAENCTKAGSYDYPIFNNCSNIKFITIGDNVKIIPAYAFYGCTKITSVTIPNGVTSIGDWSFYCTSLTSITIGDGVINIGKYAFLGCSSLTSVTIGDSVTSIGYGAFSNCNKLTSVTISDSVKSIGDWAFKECSRLTSITIPNSVTSIGDGAFFNCTSLSNININDNNKNYKSIDGNLYSKDGKTLIQYAIGKTNKAFFIPNGVTDIGDDAFYGCSKLTSVTIPDSVKSIGGSAFNNCTSLTSVTIPDVVTSIGHYVFSGCKSLTSVTIPESVMNIGINAFGSCSLLKTINYKGSEQQWNSISKGSDWNYGTGSYTINYNYS